MKSLPFTNRILMTLLMAAGMMFMDLDVLGQTNPTSTGSCTNYPTITSGDCSFSQGDGSDVDADNAAAFGGSSASGTGSFAAASGHAQGVNSVSFAESTAIGEGAFAASQGDAEGDYSTAVSNGDAFGLYAAAIGDRCLANADRSIVIGSTSRADGASAISIGLTNYAYGSSSFAIGAWTKTNSAKTFNYVFGKGLSITDALENDISNSMMLGMNSDVPTVFIGNSGGTSGSYGNVGIGNITDDAASLLHVRDQVRVGYDSEDNGSIIFNNSTNSNTVTFQSGVTFSTHSYTLPLSQGSADEVLTNDGSGNLSWEDPDANAWQLNGNSNATASSKLGTLSNQPLMIYAANLERMRVTTDGNVGIGTTVPDGLLHLKGESAGDTYLIIEKSATTTGALLFDNGGDVQASLSFNDDEDVVLENNKSNRNMIFNINKATTLTEGMIIEGTTTNVGIGEHDPASKLHVNAPVGDPDIVRFTQEGADGFIRVSNSGSASEFAATVQSDSYADDRPSMQFRAMVHSSTEDTGTDPVMNFDVRINSTNNPIQNRPIYQWSNDGTDMMTMLPDGSVGIGTTTPSGTLDVNGSLFAALSQTSSSPPTGPGNNVKILATGELIEYTSTGNHKTQIDDIQFDKEAFLSLRPVDFRWKEAFGGGQDIGLIAEEVEQLMPNMVNYHYKHTYIDQTTGEMLRDSLGNPVLDTTQLQPWGVDYRKISVYLLALAKEQDSLLGNMQDRLNALESIVQNCCSAAPSYKMGTSTSEQNGTAIMKKADLNVYPNPNDGNFTIDYQLAEGESGKLYLITVSGEKMLLSNNVRSVGKEDFNISGPSGIYQVILEGSNGEILKNVKVVIAR